MNTEQATEEYFSNSTIDNPPREPKEGETQQDIPGTEPEADHDQIHPSRKVTMDLTLKLKLRVCGEDKTISLPLLAGECEKDHVLESLDNRLFSAQVQSWLNGIVGPQRDYYRADNARRKHVHWKDEHVEEEGTEQES